MGYDLSVAPRFGDVGYWLYRKTGLFLGKRLTENIASNRIVKNLQLNIRNIDPDYRVSFFFQKLLNTGSLNIKETARFGVEWKHLNKIFSSIPLERMIWHCYANEGPNGEVIKRTESIVIIKPSDAFLKDFKETNDAQARNKGIENFKTRTLRDAFWYQLDMITFIAESAAKMGRGIFME
jgi:hypothetical protein